MATMLPKSVTQERSILTLSEWPVKAISLPVLQEKAKERSKTSPGSDVQFW